MADPKPPRVAGAATGERPTGSRIERKRDRTRAALIAAAQHVLAEQGVGAGVQSIAETADVALGTLYYHFADKNELLAVAAQQALADYEAYMSEQTAHLDDPAEIFATRVRLMLRAPELSPAFARLFVRSFPDLLTSPQGYSSLAMRDVQRAIGAGEFVADNPGLILLAISGAAHALLAVRLKNPAVDGQWCDDLAEVTLSMFGVASQRAKELAHKPLDHLKEPGPRL
ncbi:MAG: TetR/AcrR family transcriptional regulator [Actinomycetes bacterium]